MSSLTSGPKFLLDENVHRDLYDFLLEEKVDIKLTTKGLKDSEIAGISKKEEGILVTNDSDFSWYLKDKIFSVVWLKISQNRPDLLIKSFEKLLKKKVRFRGKLVVLRPEGQDIVELGEKEIIGNILVKIWK